VAAKMKASTSSTDSVFSAKAQAVAAITALQLCHVPTALSLLSAITDSCVHPHERLNPYRVCLPCDCLSSLFYAKPQ